jgi:hypothetical protein
MFERVEPFVSKADVEAGSRGFDDIKGKLDGSSFCIAVVTKETENAPWINFEAGALSKQVANAHVRIVPCLVGYESEGDLVGPLKQFQAKMLNKQGIIETLQTLCKAVSINWTDKERPFERLWDEYDEKFKKAAETGKSKLVARPDKDMLKEVVTLTRDINEQIATLTTKVDMKRTIFSKIESNYKSCRVELRTHLDEKYDTTPPYPRVVTNTLKLYILASEDDYENHGEFLDGLAEKYEARIVIYQELL